MNTKPKIAVILSGCGVYDGSEIHETVLSLLEIEAQGAEYSCFASNVEQHHVINHLTGEEMPEKRNVLVEAARIARGAIRPLNELELSKFDALFLPGGFGVAKNFTKWAFSGPKGEILPEIKQVILTAVNKNMPIGALCMAPTTLAKAFENENINATLTVGTTKSASPYDIAAISNGMVSVGAKAAFSEVNGVVIDAKNKIVTSPCYMMDASISQIHKGIKRTVESLLGLVKPS